MARRTPSRIAPLLATTLAALAGASLLGCNDTIDAPELSKPSVEGIPNVAVPPADGPKLGAIGHVTPVYEAPRKNAKRIGYLHAGASVARAEEPYTTEGCAGGWYPIRPRGFVCAGESASTDLSHPTMVAMSLQPKTDQPLPYAYARVRKETKVYERVPDKKAEVRPISKLERRDGLAIVGSWSASDPSGSQQRLGLMTDGHFVRAADLEAAEPSDFFGIELDGKETALPVGFVVKRGVRTWKVDGHKTEKDEELEYHQKLALTGRYRTIKGVRYWALTDGRWVRHPDVTTVRRRNVFPDFATKHQRWMDVSVVTGTVVLYEGQRAVYTTLISVGRDRLGDPEHTASTPLGTFPIVGKHVTGIGVKPKKALAEHYELRDVPYVLALENGYFIHGSFWHDRFGIEHGPGNLQLSPRDAMRVWNWATPRLPEGWHGYQGSDEGNTIVLVRK